jgi:hypothetical protein
MGVLVFGIKKNEENSQRRLSVTTKSQNTNISDISSDSDENVHDQYSVMIQHLAKNPFEPPI